MKTRIFLVKTERIYLSYTEKLILTMNLIIYEFIAKLSNYKIKEYYFFYQIIFKIN